MHPDLIDRLRTDLRAADYRVGAIAEMLGASADAARRRGVLAPARRALRARAEGALPQLIRLLLLGDAVDSSAIDAALPALGAEGALALGLVEETPPGSLRAALSLTPVEVADARKEQPLHWWILSDLDDHLRSGPARADHVMGVGGATRSLIGQAPPYDAPRCLDLGTGCGVVAMHLALRGRVVATDISERALMMARANARLNGLEGEIEFRRGDLFAPVAGERFDLILSNPPFVITPRSAETPVYEYRDGGMIGDALAERVVREAPELLAEGGELLCLANWESPWGGNGLERVRAWITGAGERLGALDAWVIERDRVEPVQYAETWARDGGARPGSPEFDELVEGWLDDFSQRRIVAVGLGSIRVRRSPRTADGGVVHVEHAAGGFRGDAPGDLLSRAFDAGAAAELMSDDEVLATRWLIDPAVGEAREHRPGEEAPRSIVLTTDRPIARRIAADPLLAAAVGVCDGELALGPIADALATLLEVDAGAAAEALVSSARELAWCGMLVPIAR
ncbi:class I SAM-dependent methyltransferase [Leucobacter triazinivorans]|uniref:Methyltransferase domain-containing protein n=1 Tax=Leucobacter triazinivorans TaxID=1784719 RepID=A0A4P6KC98_9MICO|nr:methyltransferase [Leucobacter triazinivorans]QBE47610.1 methyltransferase domain-containing protein [Leucobacter triazinivorans]